MTGPAQWAAKLNGKPYMFSGRRADPDQLGMANRRRATTAAKTKSAAAREALAQHRENLSPRDLQILQARADDPAATLRELGARLGMTKSSYSSGLRRALRTTKGGSKSVQPQQR